MLPDYFYIIHYSISIVASTIGSIFALCMIIIVCVNRKCRTIATFLTCDTALAVILFSTLNILSAIFSLRAASSDHQPACAFRAYCYTVLSAVICYSYAIQAISRLFFTVLYSYQYLLSWRFHWLMIAIRWCICLSILIIPFFVEHGYGLEVESRLCIPSSQFLFTSIYSVFTVFFIPFNFTVVAYSIIFYHVRQSTRRVVGFALNAGRVTGNRTILNVRREIKLMKNMVILLTILFWGGTPYLVLVLWHAVQKRSLPEALYLSGMNCVPICIALNMVALFFMNNEVSKHARQYLRKLWPH